jgi:cell division inhibitor SulA
MPKYVIERELPGAGRLSGEQLQAISGKSCAILRKLGPQIRWLHSYVTPDKIFCVYIAPNEEIIREHARLGGFPVNRISQVMSMLEPTAIDQFGVELYSRI